jgi:mono/diheme cytochrome c family protein
MKRLTIVALMLVVGCGDNKVKHADAMPDAQDPVDRGRYIMNVTGACTFCHTPLNADGSRDMTRLFAGVNCLFDIDTDPNNGVGCLSSRNLTNDPTGLMNATDAQIKDAFQNGHRTDGKTLTPVMPYWVFHNMSDDDANAIVAYLRTVPGVNHTLPPNEEPWLDINNNGPVSPYIDPTTQIPLPTTGETDLHAMHGRYLAAEAGLCVDCHTPAAPMMGLFPPIDLTKTFEGGRQFPKEQLGLLDPSYPPIINSRNLTPDATGLMGYSIMDIENAIAKGKDPMGNAVCAATHGSQISPYAALEQGDLDDIAAYVAALPPAVNDTSPNCAGPPVP